jgi:hypothetical protein
MICTTQRRIPGASLTVCIRSNGGAGRALRGIRSASLRYEISVAVVVFAIEELSRRCEEKTNGIVLTAVILAGITAQAVFGNYDTSAPAWR